MLKKTLHLSLLLLIISCGSKLKTSDGKTIDLSQYKSWPDSLSIETYNGGGMIYAWSKIFISKDSCYFIDSREGNDNRYNFKLAQSELDALLHDLIQNNIEKMTLKKTDEIIYDKGTTSIAIKLGASFINIGDGASEIVSELVDGDFIRCYNTITRISQTKTSVNKKRCCFNLDQSLKLKSKSLHIIAADTNYSDSTHLLKPNICFHLLSGTQSFQIHIIEKSKVSYTNYFASIYPKFLLKNDTSFTLKLVNDSVLVLD